MRISLSPRAAARALILVAACAGAVHTTVHAQTTEEVFAAHRLAHSTDRIIVKMRVAPGAAMSGAQERGGTAMNEHVRRFATRTSVALEPLRLLAGQAHLLRLPGTMSLEDARALARRIAQDPEVEYAEPDYRIRLLQVTPNDAEYPEQWYLHDPIGGIRAPEAWQFTVGNPSIVVAVLDSGIVTHADLVGRTVPGYDLVSADANGQFAVANDGNGRDDESSDPGDWITTQEKNSVAAFINSTCPAPEDSSWHGTLIAGIIGAASNNGNTAAGHGVSIAGVTWTSMIQPVRVFGKCLGYLSDFAEGVRWAAGLPVSGTQPNSTPAQVINLSVGANGACPQTMRQAFSAAFAAGLKAAVIAAGNENQFASAVWPGNCGGNIIAVTATRKSGDRTSYGNFGAAVAIAAPGGENPFTEGLISISNSGLRGPEVSPDGDSLLLVTGTSFSAPLVAGAAALVLAQRPELSAQELRSVLQASARPFPPTSDCAQNGCGAGLLDARAAVDLARTGFIVSPFEAKFAPTPVGQTSSTLTVTARNYSAGAINIGTVALSGAAAGVFNMNDACGGKELAGGDICTIALSFVPNAASTFSATLTIPSNAPSGNATVRLLGIEASVAPPPTTPAATSDSGGGGCTLGRSHADWSLALLLLCAACARIRVRRVRAT